MSKTTQDRALEESGVRSIRGEAALLLTLRRWPDRWSIATLRAAFSLPRLADSALSTDDVAAILDVIQREIAR
jgi:hypothetical protein